MNKKITYQLLNQPGLNLTVLAGKLLNKWIKTSVSDDFATSRFPAQLTAGKSATGFSGQDESWEQTFHRNIMMDIRGANP